MVPFEVASSACRPGTISPAENTWIWNLLSVISATYFENSSEAPYSVSSDFGKLDVMRHLSSGIDCAIAGEATAALAAAPAAETFRKSRRFIQPSPWWAFPGFLESFVRRCDPAHRPIPARLYHGTLAAKT